MYGPCNRLVGDPEAEAFINLTFTREVAETYQKLPLGVMKADFWRCDVIPIVVYKCSQQVEELMIL